MAKRPSDRRGGVNVTLWVLSGRGTEEDVSEGTD